jgi:hypothetical protein
MISRLSGEARTENRSFIEIDVLRVKRLAQGYELEIRDNGLSFQLQAFVQSRGLLVERVCDFRTDGWYAPIRASRKFPDIAFSGMEGVKAIVATRVDRVERFRKLAEKELPLFGDGK